MKVYQIEDTIIAYFDGRLSDTESAELLHRVSVSPEIRDLFAQHEMLRGMATRAARNVSVSPNVEAAVFANVAALQREERRKAPVAFWSMRRGAIVAGALALLAVGVAESYNWSGSPKTANVAAVEPTQAAGNESIKNPTEAVATLPSVTTVRTLAGKDIVMHKAMPAATREAVPVALPYSDPSSADVPIAFAALPRDEQAEHIQPPGIIAHSISDLAMTPRDDRSRFEIGLASNTQTVWPGNAVAAAPFQDWALHAAYALDEHDLAGLRIEYGMFGSLKVVQGVDPQFTAYTASMTSGLLTTYGLFYTRREEFDHGRFLVDGSVGAGGYSGGSYLSASAGLRIPIAEHFLAGATVSITRRHQNGQTKQDLLSSQSGPVLYDGPDIHNTLLGRIEYGLSYRF